MKEFDELMPQITDLFAFITEEKGPEDEGIVAMKLGDTWIPLIVADIKRAETLKPFARDIARATGKKVKLIHFIVREDLEEIK